MSERQRQKMCIPVSRSSPAQTNSARSYLHSNVVLILGRLKSSYVNPQLEISSRVQVSVIRADEEGEDNNGWKGEDGQDCSVPTPFAVRPPPLPLQISVFVGFPLHCPSIA